jgi:hypothetical protein
MSSKLNTAIAVAGIDIGENSFHVEAEDVKGTVAALDFAIAVIGTVPPVEDFNDLDPMPDQCITQGRSIRWRWVRCLSKYPPAKPGALVLEPLRAACPCRTRQSVPSTLWNAPHLMTC